MGQLNELFDDYGQSPWLDNLRRDWLRDGTVQRYVERGIRGITSNPSIFQKAISGGRDYDEQFAALRAEGATVEHAYWEMVSDDIRGALDVLAPVYESSGGVDGYVSVEVAPALAHDQAGTEAAARWLHQRLSAPNLYVKVPATVEGVAAIATLIGESISINVTLIFSLDRYAEVIEAYLCGLESATGDLGGVTSVASFFISRVDTEIDNRLSAVGTPEALALRGKGAVAQAKLAYALFQERFSGPRWERLVARGARVQRPLWASTSTKNPAYPDTLYVDSLIGPHTVNTLPDATIAAFENHGTLARTIDVDVESAQADWAAIGALIDLDDVAAELEREGVDAFQKAFDDLLVTLAGQE
jgi:transaldolase